MTTMNVYILKVGKWKNKGRIWKSNIIKCFKKINRGKVYELDL